MTRKTRKGMQTINLDAEQGNEFYLIGVVVNLNKTLKLPNIVEILEEMQKGDYCHLLKTVEKYFGDYLILETEDENLFNAIRTRRAEIQEQRVSKDKA